MKKFLSLVLALIMTMSLVTIGAGATEYRDLTDKDEIQYEEAVAVLNRIGVITGYEDGSFRPETELTRGAAAKIIVSLLIGPEAASNLPNATAPYPDVPASHTFAGVISYCKTAGIISGYGDGTFKPGNSLTGFAFAKMLLGALGYNSQIEGFVDTGWTMNVAKVGNVAGLFDRLDFDGAGAVNRETACQLALNTLKATMVTYGGTTMVTGAQTLAVQGTQAMYVTSNNREINANINRRVINATNNEMTLEFGEEHFKDLRLEHDKYDPAYDDFGRPSDQWSWKKVTIGTFALPADFTYTNLVAYRQDSVATKEKALDLRGYDTYSTDHRGTGYNWSSPTGGVYTNVSSPFKDATQITINGWNARVYNKDYKQTAAPTGTLSGQLFDYDADNANKETAPTLAEIADLTDNGVTVEVYVCPVDADFITNVVVVRTQLMKVKRIGSDYVTLEDVKPDSRSPYEKGDLAQIVGYNAFAIDRKVMDVKDNNYDAYNTLKDLKAGDYVAVVPYTPDQNKSWEVGEAYVPETVSGRLTDVGIYNNATKPQGSATSINIGGTKYVINEWNKDMIDVQKNQINATRKDVTGYLAKDGTVLWTTEIGNADAWMIVGDYYQATAPSGKVEWFVHGWTIGNEEVDINLGTVRGAAEKYAPGELVHYAINTAGTGEYKLEKPYSQAKRTYYSNKASATTWNEPVNKNGQGIYNVSQYVAPVTAGTGLGTEYKIRVANSLLPLEQYKPEKITTPILNGGLGGKIYSNETANEHAWSYNTTSLKSGVKFIYVTFDVNGEVDYITYRTGAQNVEHADLAAMNTAWVNVATNSDKNWILSPAEAYVNKDGEVEAVVIKSEPAVADLSSVIIITSTDGAHHGRNGAGAEDTTSTPLNSSQYEYVQGPNFDLSEAKVGYFTNPHNVGDILTIRSTDKDGRMDCKLFNSGKYQNRNPDAFKAEGIAQLTSANDVVSKIAFGINGKYKVTQLDGTAMSGATILSEKLSEGDQLLANTYKNLEGFNLIKVGDTKWVDLHSEANTNPIESLSDLYDYYKPETVKLSVLVNGKDTTDGFRSAYAIVVMYAEPKDGTTSSTTGYVITPTQAADPAFLSDAFKNHEVVVVDNLGLSPFNLTDYGYGSTTKMVVPNGKTLRFTGSVARTSQFNLGQNSKLVVNSDLVIDSDIYASNSVSANNATIDALSNNVAIAGTVNVTNATTVAAGETVAINGTYKTGSIAKAAGATSTVNVNGTLNVGGVDTPVGTTTVSGLTINVYSTSSLHIYGTVSVDVTIQTGTGVSTQASKNGRVTISGSMEGTFKDKNVAPTTGKAPIQDIAKVEGPLEMSTAARLTTEDFSPSSINLAVGATITLEKGTDNSDVVFQDGVGPKDTGTEPATIVIGTAADTDVTDGSTTITGEVTDASGEEAPGTVTVQLADVVENVDIMANGKILSASPLTMAEGEITLTTSTLASGKEASFAVVDRDSDPVTVTNNKFTAVANEAYTVTATVATPPQVKLAAAVDGVTVKAGTVTLSTTATSVTAEALTLSATGVPEGKVATFTVNDGGSDVTKGNGESFTFAVNKTYTITVTLTNAPAAPTVKLTGAVADVTVTAGSTTLTTTAQDFTAGTITLTASGSGTTGKTITFTVNNGTSDTTVENGGTFNAAADTNYTVTVTVKTKVNSVTIKDATKPAIANTATDAPSLTGVEVATVNGGTAAADLAAVEFDTATAAWEVKASGGSSFSDLTDWTALNAGDTVKLTLTAKLKGGAADTYVLASPAPTASVEITVS